MSRAALVAGGLLVAAAIFNPGSAHAFAPVICNRSGCPPCYGNRACGILQQYSVLEHFLFPLINILLFLGMAYLLGQLVKRHAWPVGYTRKILAFVVLLAPFGILALWPRWFAEPSLPAGLIGYLICIGLLTSPLRRRAEFLRTAFAAIDRPEDQPLTILWLVTSFLAMMVVVGMWLFLLPAHYLFVALFISGVGDALAEPVGIAFGRHKYQTRALWTDRTYTRSLEGSACVLVSGFVAITILVGLGPANQFSGAEIVLAGLLIPLAGALAEARSPHTWDQPFIVAGCGLATGLVLLLVGKTDLMFPAFP